MPESIRKARNIAIILGYIELFLIFCLIPYFVKRRSKIVIAIVILAFGVSILGLWAKIRLSWWGLMVHSCFTVAVIGGFYIYQVIDFCVGTDTPTGGINETGLLVVMSLPLLFIFILGLYSLYLLLKIDDELEQRKIADGDSDEVPDVLPDHTVEVLKVSKKQIEGNECVICMDKPKDSIFYPCGHKHVCEDCGKRFKEEA